MEESKKTAGPDASEAFRGLLDIVLRGQGLATILPDAGILLGFAVVFFGIGILRFKYE